MAPLAPFNQFATFALVIAGLWMLVSSAWSRGTATGRRQAVLLGLAGCVPLVGGMLWSARHALNLPIPVNLTPVLFPVLNLALGYELIRSGLADIAPYAALQAFNALTDGAIALADDREVIAINRVAQRLFPSARVAMPMDEAAPEVAAACARCLGSAGGYTGFDLQVGGLLYWVRVRRTTDAGRSFGLCRPLGDVTEMRRRRRVVELSRTHGEDLPYERRSRAGRPPNAGA